ncbi:hypothetical protein [Actinoplanes sp. NPDC049265]|uniref:hypothetical protein n=1 Tax=Actinoplanes sp. NPDC049265 TaxID=3363902 RepID=UPI0037114B18
MKPPVRKLILTVHVITAVGWLGVDLAMLTFGVAGLSGADPNVVYPAQSLIGRFLFVPLTGLVWLVGVTNALSTPWGLFRHWWVVVKLGVTTLMLFLVTFLLYPQLASGVIPEGPDRVNLVVAPAMSTSLMIFATVLSTYKPWGRILQRRAKRSSVLAGS